MSRGRRTSKEAHELEIMRRAGKIVAGTLKISREMATPGTRTRDIHDEVHRFIIESGAFSSFYGYDNPTGGPRFDGVICASVNEEVVHGVPGRRKLDTGDIFSSDCAVYLVGKFDDQRNWIPVSGADEKRLRALKSGASETMDLIDQMGYATYHADAAITVGVGEITPEASKLIQTTRECLELAVRMLTPGMRLSRVSRAIQDHAEKLGFSVVRQYVGHGIGRAMHEAPQVPNFAGPRSPLRDVTLQIGDVLAVEPMLNCGTYECVTLGDGWSVVTRDRRLSAHFEHSIAIAPGCGEVITA